MTSKIIRLGAATFFLAGIFCGGHALAAGLRDKAPRRRIKRA